MSEEHPTAQTPPVKPSKPHPDFPLFPHWNGRVGRWAKKIRGKLHYFGPWDGPDAALAKYLEQRDALHAGRKPRVDPQVITVKDIANQFLHEKKGRVDAGELSIRTWTGYKTAVDLLVSELGKTRLAADLGPDDFAKLWKTMAARWGPFMLGNTIQAIRCVFKYAHDAGLIDHPIRFGPGFKRPSKKTFRVHRAKQGAKLFSADEVRRILSVASVQLRAMVLLGVNAGFGNADIGNLPLTAVDLAAGWIDYPRPKTGIGRRCPLWPETTAAIREALAHRPDPRNEEDAGLVFVTKYGKSWAKDIADSPITKELRKLLDRLDIPKGRSFYALRHTFRTIADEAKDQPAADHVMGHEVAHMSSVYRERISDERLRAVVHHVRTWLFSFPIDL